MFLIQTIIYILLFFVLMYSFHIVFAKVFKIKTTSIIESLVFGVVVFYALFQIVAVPLIFLRMPFFILNVIWLVVTVLMVVYTFVLYRNYKERVVIIKEEYLQNKDKLFFLVFGLVAFQLLLTCALGYNDTDTAYFNGNIATTLQENTMFLHDPYTGRPLEEIDMRHAISAYTMACAVFSSWLNMPVLWQMQIALPLCMTLVGYMVYYLIGKHIFGKNIKAVYIFLSIVSLVYLWGFYSGYSATVFFIGRTAQGKALLGGIIIPLMLLLFLRIYSNPKKNTNYIYLLLLNITAVCFSGTSLFIMLAACGIFSLILTIAKRQLLLFIKIVICMLPSVIFGLIYYLC